MECELITICDDIKQAKNGTKHKILCPRAPPPRGGGARLEVAFFVHLRKNVYKT